MDIEGKTWDQVLACAYEALRTPNSSVPSHESHSALDAAYAFCSQLIKLNSPTFYLASSLLPEHKRRAVRALYAFCRATDDLIDQLPPDDGGRRAHGVLESWRERLAQQPNAYDPVLLAWADTKANNRIPQGYERQLLEGIARDLRQWRYATFAELAEYCYGVASTVGLMVMHIVEFQSEAALPYAVKLGIALQLTNILRDVGSDWHTGRLYLPLDELANFGLCEVDIARGRVDDRWRAFMGYQIARTRAIYAEAEPGIPLLDPNGRFAIAAAAGLYRSILEDIEAHDFEVFHRRAHIGAWGKLRRLPGIWWATHAHPQACSCPRLADQVWEERMDRDAAVG
ncbi:MAG TPA: squalene/phytoene synthase family protein [Ktedonobacterales bacterium]|nr:squalene/phytoene synthase family protein [Ktedonobacterales bacterium]